MHFRQSRDDCRDYLTAIIKITCRIHVVLAVAVAQCAHSSGENRGVFAMTDVQGPQFLQCSDVKV
jgi:hypothetical protein